MVDEPTTLKVAFEANVKVPAFTDKLVILRAPVGPFILCNITTLSDVVGPPVGAVGVQAVVVAHVADEPFVV